MLKQRQNDLFRCYLINFLEEFIKTYINLLFSNEIVLLGLFLFFLQNNYSISSNLHDPSEIDHLKMA